MRLRELETYKKIMVQCHDNPDADALASGFGLYRYFGSKGISVSLIYSGSFRIQKSNLVLLVDELKIPVEYVEQNEFTPLTEDELLITVDCQYGAGNVTKLPASNVAVIDHHQLEIEKLPLMFMDASCGSCSTIVWRLLLQEGFDANRDEELATALYYGLYTDTNQLGEIYNPYDKDMRDELQFDQSIVTRLKNSNFSLSELEIAGIALIRCIYNEANRYAVVKAEPCDPNILGMISDLMLQVNTVDTCVVYSNLTDGIKISVRSCIKEVRADELARFLTKGVGTGGGHIVKAGGFISRHCYDEHYQKVSLETYFSQRLDEYFAGFDIVYAKDREADISGMRKYKKCRVPLGFVKSSSILPVGTPVLIRTLKGDVDASVSDDIYIMIGTLGEVYPISREIFERSYDVTGASYRIDIDYSPTIKDMRSGRSHSLMQNAYECVEKNETQVYAKPITKAVKVFPLWDDDRYMLGKKEDYLAVRADDLNDIFVVEKDIFDRSYERLEENES